MRTRRYCIAGCFATALMILPGLAVNGQEPPKALLVDEFRNLFCTEDNRARFDSFLLEIQRQPGSVGYVIGNADASIPGRFQKYFRSFQGHILFRQFDPDRVKFFRGPNGDFDKNKNEQCRDSEVGQGDLVACVAVKAGMTARTKTSELYF